MSDVIKRVLLSETNAGIEAATTAAITGGLDYFLGDGLQKIPKRIPLFGGMPKMIYVAAIAGGASFIESQVFSVLPEAIQNKYISFLSAAPLLAKPVMTGAITMGLETALGYFLEGQLYIDYQVFAYAALAELVSLQIKSTVVEKTEDFVMGQNKDVSDVKVAQTAPNLFMGLF